MGRESWSQVEFWAMNSFSLWSKCETSSFWAWVTLFLLSWWTALDTPTLTRMPAIKGVCMPWSCNTQTLVEHGWLCRLSTYDRRPWQRIALLLWCKKDDFRLCGCVFQPGGNWQWIWRATKNCGNFALVKSGIAGCPLCEEFALLPQLQTRMGMHVGKSKSLWYSYDFLWLKSTVILILPCTKNSFIHSSCLSVAYQCVCEHTSTSQFLWQNQNFSVFYVSGMRRNAGLR